MKGWRFRNQQGTVLVFTLIVLVFLLVMGGLAIDLAYHASARGELQRSIDRKSTRLNSSHIQKSRMPSSA